jgi:hypothetical protein
MLSIQSHGKAKTLGFSECLEGFYNDYTEPSAVDEGVITAELLRDLLVEHDESRK